MVFVERNSVEDHSFDLSNYLKDLKKHATVTEKIKQLSNLSCLTFEDTVARSNIRGKVYNCLIPYYSNCQVFIYGSSINGFGTKGCDLDLLFLPSPEYCKSRAEKEVEEDPVPSLGQVHKGEISESQLLGMSENYQLQFACCVLQGCCMFQKILFIPAKCPILNFLATDNKSLLSCDLSCRNSLVVHNTELLRFFESIDYRVKPLVITLRFWAKALGIIKTLSLSSYAFTLLIIFFLQNTNPPILPSVDFLMGLSNSSCVVAGWEASFIQDLTKVPKTENQSNEGELLQDFFSFFWNFDFVRNVVCIRTGKKLPIKELKNSHIKGFEVSAICIQDPFDLSHNVGKNMKPNSLHLFKSFLLSSYLLTKEFMTDGENFNDDGNTFASLFDAESLNHKIRNMFHIPDFKSTELMISLNHEIISYLGDGEYLLKNWYAKASEAVLELLTFGLLMECEVIDKACFILNKCVEDKKDIDKYQNCLLTIQCAVYDRVWNNRKRTPIYPNISGAEQFPNLALQIEHMLSKSVIHSTPDLSCKEPLLWFLCKCYKTDFSQTPHLFISLTPLTKSKEYSQVCNFLWSIIPKAVPEMLIKAN